MSLYNRVIIKVAAKKSFVHISWLVTLIGIPIVFFADGLSWLDSLILFVGMLLFFWLFYLILCVLFHRLSLRHEDNKVAFLAKSDIEKGDEVGSKLEGW